MHGRMQSTEPFLTVLCTRIFIKLLLAGLCKIPGRFRPVKMQRINKTACSAQCSSLNRSQISTTFYSLSASCPCAPAAQLGYGPPQHAPAHDKLLQPVAAALPAGLPDQLAALQLTAACITRSKATALLSKLTGLEQQIVCTMKMCNAPAAGTRFHDCQKAELKLRHQVSWSFPECPRLVSIMLYS